MTSLLPDEILAWIAVVGVCAAILGERRWGAYLVAPAVMRWVIAPVALPTLRTTVFEPTVNTAVDLPLWTDILIAPVVCIFLIFAILRAFQIVVAAIYGDHVSVRVTAHAIVKTCAVMGRVTRWLFALPIHLFSNRQRMDELLRKWKQH